MDATSDCVARSGEKSHDPWKLAWDRRRIICYNILFNVPKTGGKGAQLKNLVLLKKKKTNPIIVRYTCSFVSKGTLVFRGSVSA